MAKVSNQLKDTVKLNKLIKQVGDKTSKEIGSQGAGKNWRKIYDATNKYTDKYNSDKVNKLHKDLFKDSVGYDVGRADEAEAVMSGDSKSDKEGIKYLDKLKPSTYIERNRNVIHNGGFKPLHSNLVHKIAMTTSNDTQQIIKCIKHTYQKSLNHNIPKSHHSVKHHNLSFSDMKPSKSHQSHPSMHLNSPTID